jgi:hypothetical protein
MSAEPTPPRVSWFPFGWTEVEIGFGLVGMVGTALSFAGVDPPHVATAVVVCSATLYLAGLLVHSNRLARTFDFIEDGGVRGDGYIPYFKSARRNVFLTHADDDTPNDELLAIYRSLLDRGVEMRRVIFLRDSDEGARWVARFGDHPRLVQRFIPPFQASVMRYSFVVIDEEVVIVSVPGSGPLDDGSYSDTFVLRHLLVIRDRAVARVFLRMHGGLWAQAMSIGSAEELAGPSGVLAWMVARLPTWAPLSRVFQPED